MLVVDGCLLLVSNQLPITHYQLPITNYPLPITHYQLPITNYPLPINIKNPPLLQGRGVLFVDVPDESVDAKSEQNHSLITPSLTSGQQQNNRNFH